MTDPKLLPDEQSLTEALRYVDSYLGYRQGFDRIPGVQAAVFARGEVRLSAAYGHADVENGTRLTERNLFRIASHSKTFTATAIMQLVDAGTLRLDDRAQRWVRALDGHAAGAVTIRELLGHVSGLTRDSTNGDFWQLDGRFPDRDRLLEILLDARSAVIGEQERFKYSNIAYGLLGLIIESATGVSYAEAVRVGVVDRLGLTDLGPELDPARSSDYAVGYSALSYAQRRVPIEHVDTEALASATGFYATARDLVRYFAAHFLGDERLLTDRAKREMQHSWWDTGAATDKQYGLGLSVATVGERTMIGHGGGYPGHITNSMADTKAGLAVSVLTNCIDGPAEGLARAVVGLIDLAGAKDRPAAGTVDPERFCGRYAGLWGVVDIAVLGGRLHRLHPALADPVDDAAELEIVDESTLRIAGGSGYGSYGELMPFTFADDGTVVSLRGESGGTLVPIDRFELPERVIVRR
jgi:CubicO group peptidase (beta-lactamase class C family)